jgi:hypothetical protein
MPVDPTVRAAGTHDAALIGYATKESTMTANDTSQSRRELAHRASNGIDVRLLWNQADNTVAVTVSDDMGESFELRVGSHEALDAFHHPYAYAAFRGSLATADLAA